MFIILYGFHILSIVFAIAGIIGVFEHITWLMVVGTILAFLTRPIGYFLSGPDTDWLPNILKSNTSVLIMSVIGAFLAQFFLKTSLWGRFLISLNGSILLFYIFALCYVMYRNIRRKLFMRSLRKNHQRK